MKVRALLLTVKARSRALLLQRVKATALLLRAKALRAKELLFQKVREPRARVKALKVLLLCPPPATPCPCVLHCQFLSVVVLWAEAQDRMPLCVLHQRVNVSLCVRVSVRSVQEHHGWASQRVLACR